MSADNYYVIRLHPDGGCTPVMGFASDTDDDGNEIVPRATREHRQFASIASAWAYANSQYTEYGVWVHPECGPDWGDGWGAK